MHNAKKNDLSFFDSIKYKTEAENTKAGTCITLDQYSKFLPKNTQKIIVKNVLLELAKVLKKLYPTAADDYPDYSSKKPTKNKYRTVKFGNNVLVGKNVKIGKNTKVGSNTIIEQNVRVGKNCVFGSNIIIKNSIVGDNVVLQDNCKIGQKGFGFIPLKDKNIKFN